MVTDIEKLLLQSDKATLLEWLQSNLPEAEKCFVVVAKKDGSRLVMTHCQFGNQYQYELVGFVQWAEQYVDGIGFAEGADNESE